MAIFHWVGYENFNKRDISGGIEETSGKYNYNLISGNFKLMMQEIQGFKSEINNLRKCPEFTQKQFEAKFS